MTCFCRGGPTCCKNRQPPLGQSWWIDHDSLARWSAEQFHALVDALRIDYPEPVDAATDAGYYGA